MPHVQIRNVPPELHRKLKARAAEAGMSLSDYLLESVLRPLAERPTMAEMAERVRRLSEFDSSESSADAIRAERARR
jgi:plasmid stability protein